MYYNKVKERYGHVFHDRYRSKAVKYYLWVLRYIHNNPVKARLSDNIQDYKWSSANDYINNNTYIISEKHLIEILSFLEIKMSL